MPQVNEMSWVYASFSAMPCFLLFMLLYFFSYGLHYLYCPVSLPFYSFKVLI